MRAFSPLSTIDADAAALGVIARARISGDGKVTLKEVLPLGAEEELVDPALVKGEKVIQLPEAGMIYTSSLEPGAEPTEIGQESCLEGAIAWQ